MNWTGGKTHLVQIGDILDRGPDSRAVMDLLITLEQQAPLQGGMFIFFWVTMK
jgi:fructose-1,6-bisphosphatase